MSEGLLTKFKTMLSSNNIFNKSLSELQRLINQTLTSLDQEVHRLETQICANITRVSRENPDCCNGISVILQGSY